MTRIGTLIVTRWPRTVLGVSSSSKVGTNLETGDHLTLIAAAEVFNCRIVIVSSIPGDSFVVEINPIRSQEVLADGTIRVVPALHLLTLSHFAEFHYGSVHPIDPEFIPFQEQGVTGF